VSFRAFRGVVRLGGEHGSGLGSGFWGAFGPQEGELGGADDFIALFGARYGREASENGIRMGLSPKFSSPQWKWGGKWISESRRKDDEGHEGWEEAIRGLQRPPPPSPLTPIVTLLHPTPIPALRRE
jgi:hypothetical protein